MVVRALAYFFGLPWSLIGLLLALAYRPFTIRWSEGCLELIARQKKNGKTRIWGRPGAQTWGCVIYYASEYDQEHAELRKHERVHALVQAAIPGYPIFWLLHWCWLMVFVPKDAPSHWPRYYRAYWGIVFERWARRVGGI